MEGSITACSDDEDNLGIAAGLTSTATAVTGQLLTRSSSKEDSGTVEECGSDERSSSDTEQGRRPHNNRVDIESLNRKTGNDASADDDDDLSDAGDLSMSCASTTATSYLHGENAEATIRHLVHLSLVKKQKEQLQRHRPKKESKRAAAGGHRRERKSGKVKKQAITLDTDFF